MKQTSLIYLLCFLFMQFSFAPFVHAQFAIDRVEPPHWWTGMKQKLLEILVYGKNIGESQVQMQTYEGVRLIETIRPQNSNYIFLQLEILEQAKPGTLTFTFTGSNKKSTRINYTLKAKQSATGRIQGFGPQDLIYLIMPDRFANGNPALDNVAGMREKADRSAPFGRHGGDIDGILQRLDYIKSLGVTALWLNPVLENDMPTSSYHGYAITDFYGVDKRFGGNEKYRELIEACHKRGMKVIKDMVMNHCGLYHWWMDDLPYPDWVNQFSEFTRSNYRLATISDPHASEHDRTLMNTGWFDTTMPDLNQRNPRLAKYLIQNTIWWLEEFGIDGIRMDTYPYPDPEFMAQWSAAVLAEYPQSNIVGEVWIHSAAMESYWLKGTQNRDGYRSTLPSITDFPLFEAIAPALNEPTGWGSGLSRLYHVLAEDFLYEAPNNNVIFLDNHDVTRFATAIGQDLNKMKMGLAFLLTTRGVPQIYYGTELLMTGDGGFHPDVRKDFPGGWAGDTMDAFTPQGRTAAQNELWNYLSTLANWRKGKSVVHHGKLTHFIPANDCYVYFRHNEKEAVMVVLHTGDQPKQLDTKPFREILERFKQGKDVISGKAISNLAQLELPARSALILELSN
ncbi:glycoside hydrolase family 13 protein [Rhodoflexus sp.]